MRGGRREVLEGGAMSRCERALVVALVVVFIVALVVVRLLWPVVDALGCHLLLLWHSVTSMGGAAMCPVSG